MGLTANEKNRFEILAQGLHIEFFENPQLSGCLAQRLDVEFVESLAQQLDIKAHKPKAISVHFDFLDDIGDFESRIYETADEQTIPIAKRKENTRRAKKIASKAMKLKFDRSKVNNSSAPKESTWRFKTEIPIFESLEKTITCKICSKRLWKSLFESPFPPDDGELEQRQERREYCKCTEEDKSDDYDLGHTMENIIKDSIEPRIIHPSLLRAAIEKDLEPDYIAGLQQHRFNQYMENPSVKAQLQDQPVKDDNMIFPFMVAEAKKEDGDAWDYTYFQTVFPIYTMLSVQWRLLSVNTANGHLLDFEPVVWFYAYRGQHWKLHLAYLDKICESARGESFPPRFQVLEDETATPDNRLISKQIPYPIKIVRVWEGDLTHEDKALQLLLIVDYMADWARDYYREMIKTGLRNLDGNSIDSQETDILSRINTRTSHTKMESSYSANDLISPSRDIQMPQRSQLQQPIGDPFLELANHGTSQSLSEPQTLKHDANLTLSNFHLRNGIPDAEPPQVALEQPPPPINTHLFFSAGIPYPGLPQSAHQLQQSPSINDVFLLGNSSLPIDPPIAQQPQPPYVFHESPSASNQHFGASQPVWQSQPEMYPATGWQLDCSVRARPASRTPLTQSRWDDSKRLRSPSRQRSPRKRRCQSPKKLLRIEADQKNHPFSETL